LSALGYDAFFASQTREEEGEPARVAFAGGGRYQVWTARGAADAIALGRLSHDARAAADLPVVGDWVTLQGEASCDGPRAIVHVYARRGAVTRKVVGRRAEGQVLAANVDRVFVVSALDAPWRARRVERFLALVRLAGAAP